MPEVAITARPAALSDLSAVESVARKTWHATYAGHIPNADIERFLQTFYSVPSLERRLDRHSDGLIVAVEDGEIVGFATVGPGDEGAAELYAIYVVPDRQGAGAGFALWRHAVAWARRAGYSAMYLWVLSANTVACRFYERQGAVPDGERIFPVGEAEITETRYLLTLADHPLS
jgi:GNAT superfamily N-acetyltransferase